jgi:hypothetical protein
MNLFVCYLTTPRLVPGSFWIGAITGGVLPPRCCASPLEPGVLRCTKPARGARGARRLQPGPLGWPDRSPDGHPASIHPTGGWGLAERGSQLLGDAQATATRSGQKGWAQKSVGICPLGGAHRSAWLLCIILGYILRNMCLAGAWRRFITISTGSHCEVAWSL